MAVTVGRLRWGAEEDGRNRYLRFLVLGSNTIRGAAGGAVLLAELLKSQKYLD